MSGHIRGARQNGTLPQFTGGAPLPFLDVKALAKETEAASGAPSR